MKNVLLFVLMLLLPLQASWSAAAVFCQHETTISTHWGHHTHENDDCQQNAGQLSQKDLTQKDLKSLASADLGNPSDKTDTATKHKFNLSTHADHLNINQHVIRQQHAACMDIKQHAQQLTFVALLQALYQSPVLEQPKPPLWPA